MTNRKHAKTQFELLSNELLLEIFEYLDIYSLFNAFHGLNQRFHQLILSMPVHYEMNGDEKYDENIWKSIAAVIKPSQIRSICLRSCDKIDERFLNSETKNVKSLILRSTSNKIFGQLLEKLPTNLDLVNFCHLNNVLYERPPVSSTMKLFFDKNQNQFHKLINASFNSSYVSETYPSKSFLYLRRLHLTVNMISFGILQILRDQTPNLKSLSLVFPQYSSWDPLIDQTMRLENIRELDININVNLPYFFHFLSVFVNVMKLRVLWRTQRRLVSPSNGSQWQNLFEQHLTKVKRFTLEFSDDGADGDLASSFYLGDFWSKKYVHQRQVVNRSRRSTPKIRAIYFGKEWKFKYFEGTELNT